MTVFADNFLAGSIISLLMPVLLLIAIWVWYWYAAKRFSPARGRRDAQGTVPEAQAAGAQPQGEPPQST